MIWTNICIVLLSSALFARGFANPDLDPNLKIEVTRKAHDCKKVTGESDLLYVHYTSFFENGTKIGSSYDTQLPIYLPLGRGKIIQGLNDALVGMCIGEIRKITVPSHLAYGKEGYKVGNFVVPPDTTLVFEAELVLFHEERAIHEAFTKLDADKNDLLDREEIRILQESFQKISEEPHDRLEKRFTEMFTQADKNEDSLISLEEFLIVSQLQDPPKSAGVARDKAELEIGEVSEQAGPKQDKEEPEIAKEFGQVGSMQDKAEPEIAKEFGQVGSMQDKAEPETEKESEEDRTERNIPEKEEL